MKYRLTLFVLLVELALIVKLNAQSKKEYVQYLKNNSLDIKNPDADWNLVLDSSFYNNDFFWVGETHAIKFSYDAEWILFRHLHEKTGFKYYLLEAGYISELYLNRYLETGDEHYLNMDFNSKKGTMGCNMDAYEFYRKMYKYNQELPKEQRVEFVSIDIEHQYDETDKYIRSLFENHDVPKDTSDFVNIFLNTRGNYKNIYKTLFVDLHSDPAKYKSILTSDYPVFWYLVRNINYCFQAYEVRNSPDREQWNRTRDSLMFENYKIRLLTHDFKNSKVFAYFGTNHCYLENSKNTRWIASLIKNSNPAIKSASIMMLYSACKAMRPAWLNPKYKRKSSKENKDYVNVAMDNDSKNLHRKASRGDYTLFNITNTATTFKSSKIFLNDIDNDKFMRDYFQYILLIKDSPPSLPYGK